MKQTTNSNEYETPKAPATGAANTISETDRSRIVVKATPMSRTPRATLSQQQHRITRRSAGTLDIDWTDGPSVIIIY